MQSNSYNFEKTGVKKALIITLSLMAWLITCSGAAFGIYSLIYNVSFMVLGASISGGIFGVVIMYLGIRYILSISKLKKELYKPTSVFSWNNFKKVKSS